MERLLIWVCLIISICQTGFPADFENYFKKANKCFPLEEKEGSYLSEIYDINFDNHNNFYISDYMVKDVKKYNINGKLLKRFGKHGAGPGEFLFPTDVAVVKDRVIVLDAHTDDNVFTISGKFLQKTKSLMGFTNIYSYNNILIATGNLAKDKYKVAVFDENFKITKIFFDITIVTENEQNPFNTIPLDYDFKGNIYLSHLRSYKIAVFDSNYNFVRVFGKPSKRFNPPPAEFPKFVSNKAVKKWMSKFTMLLKLYIVYDKYIVLQYVKFLDNNNEYYYDIYETSGRKLAEDITFNMSLVGKDNSDTLYFYKYKDTGDDITHYLCKYKLKKEIK